MPTKDERRKALEEQLAAIDEEPDDPAFDVSWWIRGEDGQERGGSMPWAQGQKIFGQWFPDLFGTASTEPDKSGKSGSSRAKGTKGTAGGGDQGGGDEGGEGGPGVVRFGRRVS
jgi:hypothetical protein